MKQWLGVLLLGWALAAQAGAPATEMVREERETAMRTLEALGVSAAEAEARVNALTEEEVRQLAAEARALPAGGEPLTYQQIGLILLIAILVALIL